MNSKKKIRASDIQQTRKGYRASLLPFAKVHSRSYDNQCFLPTFKLIVVSITYKYAKGSLKVSVGAF